MMALIIGYVISVFVVYAVLLRMFPYREGDEVENLFAAIFWPLFLLVPVFTALAKIVHSICRIFVTPKR